MRGLSDNGTVGGFGQFARRGQCGATGELTVCDGGGPAVCATPGAWVMLVVNMRRLD